MQRRGNETANGQVPGTRLAVRHFYCHLSILTTIFPGECGLANFFEAKDDGSGGDNWSCKTCKAPVRSSPPTNQLPTFYMPDALSPANSVRASK